MRRASSSLLLVLAACAHAPAALEPPTPEGPIPPIEVRSEQGTYRFEADGTHSYEYIIHYVVRSPAGVESWREIEATWTPSRQTQPLLEATVRNPDGKVYELDPETLVVKAAGREATAARRISADLPHLMVGSEVEQRILQRSIEPRTKAGVNGRYFFGMRVPVARSTVVLDVPLDMPIALQARGLTLEPDIEVSESRRRFRYEQTNLEPLGPVDKHLPGDAPRHPHVAFSTALDWTAVADGLAQRIEPLLEARALSDTLLEDVGEVPLRDLVLEVIGRVETLVEVLPRRLHQVPTVPMHPEETLARGRGSLVDSAAVAAALLRGRGVAAQLALVRSGPGADVDPDLPGLDGFNRVLLHVDGPAPMWIDPNERHLPPGRLSPELQGRYVLPLAPGATLLRTPEPRSNANRYMEHRVFRLPTYGRADVVERTEAKGSIARRLRQQLAKEGDTHSAILNYVRGQYGATGLGEVSMSDPADVRRPVEVSVEATSTDVGRVDIATGVAEIRTSVLFGWLPALLRDAALAPDDEPDGQTEQLRQIAAVLIARREQPLLLPEPYTAELTFEVQAPAGFVPTERPDDRRLTWGPAEFTSEYELRDGVLHGRLRFDTGRARYSPDETRTLVEGLRALWEEPVAKVRYVQAGLQKIEAGQLNEGLEALARLSGAHPKSAPHRARLSLGLVAAGLGDAARQVAREAVALDETSPLARYALGHVLSHDLVGRLHSPGFDRAGAMDAFRLVKALEPGNVRARAALARMRAMDDRGLDAADPAGLEASVAEWRSLREDTGVAAFDDQLLSALLRARRFEEVLMEVGDARRSLRRDGHALAARVALDGHLDGVGEVLGALQIPARAEPLVQTAAATALASIGEYDLARSLLTEVGKNPEALGPLARQAERIERIQPFESLLQPEGDPIRVVQEVLGLVLSGRVTGADLRPLLVPGLEDARLEVEAARLSRAYAGLARVAERSRVPTRVLRDGLLSAARFEVDGDAETGFRVRAFIEEQSTWWFLRPDPEAGGRPRLVATELAPGPIGDVALALLDAEQSARARLWLEWAETLLRRGPRGPNRDPFQELPFLRLRRQSRSDLEAAALALSALGPQPEAALRGLARRSAASREVLRDTLDHARVLGLMRSEAFARARPLITRLVSRNPDSEQLAGMEIAVLLELEAWSAAGRRLRAQLVKSPDDPQALQQLANLETARGRFKKAERILEQLAASSKESSVVWNNLAWVSLFQGDVGPRDLERAQKANELSRGRSPAELHTLAAVHAEQGNAAETVELVRKRLDLRDADAPESMDYYLFGRVMEHVGLWRLARQAYLRVEKDEGSRADSTHALAQRRLRGLIKRSAI